MTNKELRDEIVSAADSLRCLIDDCDIPSHCSDAIESLCRVADEIESTNHFKDPPDD